MILTNNVELNSLDQLKKEICCHSWGEFRLMELGRGKAYNDIGFKLPFNIQRNSYNFDYITGTFIWLIMVLIFSGIKTCILTNNWTNDLVKNFRSLPFPQLLHYFDEVFESCKIGLSKPDPDIYTHVCSKMGVQPSEVYIYLLLRI